MTRSPLAVERITRDSSDGDHTERRIRATGERVAECARFVLRVQTDLMATQTQIHEGFRQVASSRNLLSAEALTAQPKVFG
jgi:hypothetical protein